MFHGYLQRCFMNKIGIWSTGFKFVLSRNYCCLCSDGELLELHCPFVCAMECIPNASCGGSWPTKDSFGLSLCLLFLLVPLPGSSAFQRGHWS